MKKQMSKSITDADLIKFFDDLTTYVKKLEKKQTKKQTAVELLEKKLKTYLSWSTFLEEDFQEAKQMEKEQIIDAHDNGYIDGANKKNTTAEQYYNETYG